MENKPAIPQVVAEKPFVPNAEQLQRIDTIAKAVDVKNTQQVLAFGSVAQEKIAKFSDEVLQRVRTSDAGEISDTLSNLVGKLKTFDTGSEKGGGFLGLFRKTQTKVETLRASFDSVEGNVTTIATTLRTHQTQLNTDIAMFDKLYDLNQEAFGELNLYIEAGDREIARLRAEELEPLRQKSAGNPEDQMLAQQVNDLAAQIDRFEKKVQDLRLTRTVSIQSAPQIRLLQNADSILTEKIESTIVNTLPLWKSQMTIALGAAHTEGALRAQQAVTDATNELLKKNADALKMNTIKTAEASQRGVVDMETIRHTNQALIETLDEVRRIEIEGKQKRKDAARELSQLEGQLRDKLVQFADPMPPAGTQSFEERVASAKPAGESVPVAPEAPIATIVSEAPTQEEDLSL